MISLDQVLLLEEKVESAVEKISQLNAENAALRRKCTELTNALSAKTEQFSSFQSDQNKIEEGILKALERLDSVENAIHVASKAVNQAEQPLGQVQVQQKTAEQKPQVQQSSATIQSQQNQSSSQIQQNSTPIHTQQVQQAQAQNQVQSTVLPQESEAEFKIPENFSSDTAQLTQEVSPLSNQGGSSQGSQEENQSLFDIF